MIALALAAALMATCPSTPPVAKVCLRSLEGIGGFGPTFVYDPTPADLPPTFYRDPQRFCETALTVEWLMQGQNTASNVMVFTHAATLTCKPDGTWTLTAPKQ